MKRSLAVLLVLLVGCGDDDGGADASASDASVSDASSPDGSLADGSATDAATDAPGTDGAASDAQSADAPGLDGPPAVDAGPGEFRLFGANGRLDYQLGGDYPPPEGVTIVSRDREGSPAAGLYNICYINGYQVQPGELADWEADLILRDDRGQPIIDPDWDEALLDITTADKRTRIAAVLGGWITRCAADGFDAVEIDNLDTYSRSAGRISENDAVALMALLSANAHAAGVAIAQKNSAEILGRAGEMGTDFAVVEECNRYTECDVFIETYGDYVLMIEYRDADFTRGCGLYGGSHALVRRDVNLTTPGSARYVFDDC